MCDPHACWLSGKCVPRVPPDTDPRTVTVCVCDREAPRLAELVESGIDQLTASHMLWAPERLEQDGAA